MMKKPDGPNGTSPSSKPPFRVAIVGGGITGSCAASVLCSASFPPPNSSTSSAPPTAAHAHAHAHAGAVQPTTSSSDVSLHLTVDLFDQGRRGPGGRASHRGRDGTNPEKLRFDHGAQFFRADVDRFRHVVSDWIERGFVKEWRGNFISDADGDGDEVNDGAEFFGLPSRPPFYVGADGMDSVINGVLDGCTAFRRHSDDSSSDDEASAATLHVHHGTRVANMERDPTTRRWHLVGTTGEIAYHDTPEEKVAAAANSGGGAVRLGRNPETGYDAIILTDVSSSFGKWHRASAGVPEDFATRVRERVGARVPLFAVMVAFESELNVPFDAASFGKDDTLWFAARTASKPGFETDDESGSSADCWTLVSTPEYALERITETPMQDAQTGAFIPQPPDYLTTVPGPDLEMSFRSAIADPKGILGKDRALDAESLPKTVHLDAQRWGSAMPAHRHLDATSQTRRVVSGVPYDGGRAPLAPTRVEERVGRGKDDDGRNFLADDDQRLVQAGDMVSKYTPGFEGAALSGVDAAEHVLCLLGRL